MGIDGSPKLCSMHCKEQYKYSVCYATLPTGSTENSDADGLNTTSTRDQHALKQLQVIQALVIRAALSICLDRSFIHVVSASAEVF